MLTFRFSGADGIMAETEILTSGMVGKEVKLEFSRDWEGMKKTAVFKAGSVIRDVVGVTDVAVIPAEVLAQPLRQLYVGVYGVTKDGRVTPTVRVEGPRILPGADPSGDRGTDPDLPVWAQIQLELEKLKSNDDEQPISSQALTSIGIILDNIMTILEAQVEDEDGTPQGYRTDISGLVERNHVLIGSLGGCADGEDPDTPAATDKTLSGISAAYTGGDVAVGTAVTALTGVVVTAHYSDGTSETVTGYTLNGTIAEGSNTITVTYQGKTATFTVTGAAESSGETVGLLASAKINIGTKFSWYTDEGATAYTGSIATKQALIGIASADTFDADTDVTVYLKATAQTYDHFVAASTQWDGVDVHGTDGSVVNLNCVEVGGKAWTSAGINHKITIKVKAGMRLAVFSYASDFGNPVSITAEVA